MTTVEDLEKAVEQLSPDKLDRFRDWFEKSEAARFDQGSDYSASAEELRGIDRGLRTSAEGKFASAQHRG